MSAGPSEIRSRPVYAPLAADPAAARHWLVLEAAALDAAARRALGRAFAAAGGLQVWAVGEPEAMGALSAGLGLGPLRLFADLPALTQALAAQAAAAPFGVCDRLCAQGTEPFVWAVARAAGQAGLAPSQLRLAHAGSLRRRVWCSHCHACTDGVTTNTIGCAGCGRALLVRDHFSRRHGAFMGVMVDAEVPGEQPPVQEVFR